MSQSITSKSFEFIGKYKFLIIAFFSAIIISEIIFLNTSSDIIIFFILFLYLVSIVIFKIPSRLTFILGMVQLVCMFIAFITSRNSPQTEKSAVWFVLLLAVGILQQWFEITNKSKNSQSLSERFMENLHKFIIPLMIYKNWWLFYLDFFNLAHGKLVFHLRNGLQFYAKAKNVDGLIINEVVGLKVYTPKGFEIKEKDIVVDIGAHKGYFSVYAATFATKGVVHAFEPTEINFKQLESNINLNKRKNVKAHNLGVASKKGTRTLYLSGTQVGGISMIKEWFNAEPKVDTIKVKTIKMDDVFNVCKIPSIDFLKIDCEGAEFEILLNASAATFKKIKLISMEFHEINNLRVEMIEKILRKNKFSVKKVNQHGPIGILYAKKA